MSTINVKDLFFDRAKVIAAMDKATRGALSKAGAFIMTTARQSMRRAKGPSRPGQAPHAHEGSLKKKLYFSYDPRSKSVVVGPVPYRAGTAPRTLEQGGTAKLQRKKVIRVIKIEPRPYMGPALAKEKPNLPSRWSGSVRT